MGINVEFRRKVFHIFGGLLWLIPLFYLPKSLLLIFSLFVIVLNLTFVLKIAEDKIKPIYKLIYLFERERNLERPAIQALWLNLGVFLSFLFFTKECATVGIVLTAVGDGFAGLIGYHFGKIKIGEKSLEGFLAFFVSSSLALLPFLGAFSFFVAFVGALVEILPKKIDDNFLLPLVGSALECII
ncbi:diacylglycerol/polyprenol kinase family protein [Thermocrinis sp.]